MAMTIRAATHNDLDTIRELSLEFWRAHNPRGPFDPDFFINHVRAGIDDPTFLALLLDDDQGMLLALATKSLFAPSGLAKEIVWFTRPAARGRGMQLFRGFVVWARMMGLDHIHCTLQEPSPAMERLGFFSTEVGYMRPVGRAGQGGMAGAVN
jgi:hypothetical protein